MSRDFINVNVKDFQGVWFPHNKGDVHNYFTPTGAAVIGTNVNYKDNSLQVADDNGKPRSITLSDLDYRQALLGMLNALKKKHQN